MVRWWGGAAGGGRLPISQMINVDVDTSADPFVAVARFCGHMNLESSLG